MGDLWIGGDEGDGLSGRAHDARVSEFGRRLGAKDFPALDQVLAYWTELARSVGDVPLRKAVEPKALSGALPMVFLLESVAPNVARFRVAGTQVCDLMGMEVRGMPLISIFAPKYRDDIGEALQTVLGKLAQVQLTLAGESGFGRPPLEARMLLLPLRDDFGRTTRALGALEAKGQIGRTPRRFEITAQKVSLLRLSALSRGPSGTTPGTEPSKGWRMRPGDAESPQNHADLPPARREFPAEGPLNAAYNSAKRPPPPTKDAGFAEPSAAYQPMTSPQTEASRQGTPPLAADKSASDPKSRPWLRVIQGGKT